MQTYAANAATARKITFELSVRLIIHAQSYEDACGECRDSENVCIRADGPVHLYADICGECRDSPAPFVFGDYLEKLEIISSFWDEIRGDWVILETIERNFVFSPEFFPFGVNILVIWRLGKFPEQNLQFFDKIWEEK